MNRDTLKVLGLILGIAAFTAAAWVNGRLVGYREAREQFQRPCEVTCGVTFVGDHWEVRGGQTDGGAYLKTLSRP